ncbi:hypothetical protein WJX74_005529 [Apatococcus lobatus]|uniref:Extradiol ring-cleavage dioxygenase class III enzyme subunit B domain-containing protein n=1 Tax=Apatococcus lobatus TaxID=904363 RepID=A0AAW1RYI5_9CHLO
MSAGPLPTLYLTHGGGPMPLLGHKPHAPLVSWLSQLSAKLPHPQTILLVSAHWEESTVHVSSSAKPEIIYDYYNFPPEAYQITYPAPGNPGVAQRVSELLGRAGIQHQQQARGLDHAAFVPLKLVYPQADIPVVSLSLLSSMDAQAHIDIGRALAPLRQEGVMIIGSGSSFHNLQDFMRGRMSMSTADDSREKSEAFNKDLTAALTDSSSSPEQRAQKLVHWDQLAEAKRCHPREEHLLPLMVAFGAGGGVPAEVIFDGAIGHLRISSFQFN